MQKYLYSNKFGNFLIKYKDEIITHLNKTTNINIVTTENEFTNKIKEELDLYFAGELKNFSLKTKPKGTEFQLKVWNELKRIPYGETRSYKEIAVAIGNSKASRAIGMANNKNPIAIIIPCHRVIGTNGSLTGYAGGLDMKEKLLNLEKNN